MSRLAAISALTLGTTCAQPANHALPEPPTWDYVVEAPTADSREVTVEATFTGTRLDGLALPEEAFVSGMRGQGSVYAFRLGGILGPREVTHVVLGVLIGGGGATSTAPVGAFRRSDTFFVVEPDLAAEVNLARHGAGFTRDEWHRFELFAGAGITNQPSGTYFDQRFGVDPRPPPSRTWRGIEGFDEKQDRIITEVPLEPPEAPPGAIRARAKRTTCG